MKLNKKGEIQIGQLLIACVSFLIFLTAALSVTWTFFGVDSGGDPYGSNFTSSYYGDMAENRLDKGESTNAGVLLESTSGMSDGIFNTEATVNDESSDSRTWSLINLASFKSLKELGKIYTFAGSAMREIGQKMGVPHYFFIGLFSILVIIVTIGILAALRGLK